MALTKHTQTNTHRYNTMLIVPHLLTCALITCCQWVLRPTCYVCVQCRRIMAISMARVAETLRWSVGHECRRWVVVLHLQSLLPSRCVVSELVLITWLNKVCWFGLLETKIIWCVVTLLALCNSVQLCHNTLYITCVGSHTNYIF